MRYAVTVDARVAEGGAELDPLQREGVIRLLGRHLDRLECVEGPDGMRIDVFDRVIAVHPGGARVKVFVGAPAPALAEGAVHVVMTELLARTELLADWTVARCEAEPHPHLAQQSPAPAERSRRHTEHANRPVTAGPDSAEVERMRRTLHVSAGQLHAFPPEFFARTGTSTGGDVSEEAAGTAAGALVHAVGLLVDGLFRDLAVLEQGGPESAVSVSPFLVLDELPEPYVRDDGVPFVRRLITTAVTLTGRLVQPPPFGPLTCVAEELLMGPLIARAELIAERHGLLSGEVRAALAVLADALYGSRDRGRPASAAVNALAAGPAREHVISAGDWFAPFTGADHVHPYAAAVGRGPVD